MILNLFHQAGKLANREDIVKDRHRRQPRQKEVLAQVLWSTCSATSQSSGCSVFSKITTLLQKPSLETLGSGKRCPPWRDVGTRCLPERVGSREGDQLLNVQT
jgi:hypothetical protein